MFKLSFRIERASRLPRRYPDPDYYMEISMPGPYPLAREKFLVVRPPRGFYSVMWVSRHHDKLSRFLTNCIHVRTGALPF